MWLLSRLRKTKQCYFVQIKEQDKGRRQLHFQDQFLPLAAITFTETKRDNRENSIAYSNDIPANVPGFTRGWHCIWRQINVV